MKARLLKKILNDTNYNLSNHDDYIAVGSPLCHDLISVNKKTLKVKYALDTFNRGRKCLEDKSSDKLLFIWDKLHDLINSGEIHEIINGKDVIENPLPVFTVIDGELVESKTDEYGWPNTDDNGVCMYNNTHFPTRDQAIKYGINEYEAGVRMTKDTIMDHEIRLKEAKERLNEYQNRVDKLKKML